MEEKKGLPILQILFAAAVAALVILFNDEIAGLGSWGYFGVFLVSALSSATILVPVPSWGAVIALGGVLNPLLVGVCAGIGSAIGELTSYLFGSGVAELAVKNKKQYEKYKEWIKRNDFWAIFALSFLPNPLFDVAGLAAGAAKVSPLRFVIFCAVGRTLRFTLFGFAGYYLLNGT
ncbi:MAG: VTT domain-containing protein [Candidatus Bilamarchaeaceae archaeon]